MDVEVRFTDGTKTLVSTLLPPECSDCGGIPPKMWTWEQVDNPLRYKGEPFLRGRDVTYGVDSEDQESLDLSSWRAYDSLLVTWSKAINSRRRAFSDSINDQDWESILPEDVSHPSGIDPEAFASIRAVVGHFDEVRKSLWSDSDNRLFYSWAHGMVSRVDRLYKIRHVFTTIPEDSAGVCSTHGTILEPPEIPLYCEVGANGQLSVSAQDEVVLVAAPGAWLSYVKVP